MSQGSTFSTEGNPVSEGMRWTNQEDEQGNHENEQKGDEENADQEEEMSDKLIKDFILSWLICTHVKNSGVLLACTPLEQWKFK